MMLPLNSLHDNIVLLTAVTAVGGVVAHSATRRSVPWSIAAFCACVAGVLGTNDDDVQPVRLEGRMQVARALKEMPVLEKPVRNALKDGIMTYSEYNVIQERYSTLQDAMRRRDAMSEIAAAEADIDRLKARKP
jgi:hypothetical protein